MATDTEGKDPLAVEILKRQDRLETERAPWESIWRDITQRVMPQEEVYFNGGTLGAGHTISTARSSPAFRRDQFQYDSGPTASLEKYAAALSYYSIPSNQLWHTITPSEPKLKKNNLVKRYCEDWRDLLFSTRYSGSSTFDAQGVSCFWSNGLYGTGLMFIEDRLSKGIGYQAIHMSEAYLVIDRYGNVESIHRKYKLTAEQAAKKFGREKLPEQILRHLTSNQQWEKEFHFIHCVKPNDNIMRGAFDYEGMAYVAYDVNVESKTILQKNGFKRWPFAMTRHVTLPGQAYAISPALMCLADIKTLNEMVKQNLRYAQMKNFPPIITMDADSLKPFSLRPSAINMGYLNEDGKPGAMPFEVGGDPRFAIEIMEAKKQAINSNFYNTLFDILVQTPEMTATQALIRSQEKGALLAPVVSRQRSEFLNVIITREMQILEDAGAAPEPPEALLASGAGLNIEYESPLARAQKAEQAAGIMRTVDIMNVLTPLDPSVKHKLNLPKALELVAYIYSCPAELIRGDEEWMELVQREQEAIAEQEKAAMAMEATKGVSNLANAERALNTNQKAA